MISLQLNWLTLSTLFNTFLHDQPLTHWRRQWKLRVHLLLPQYIWLRHSVTLRSVSVHQSWSQIVCTFAFVVNTWFYVVDFEWFLACNCLAIVNIFITYYFCWNCCYLGFDFAGAFINDSFFGKMDLCWFLFLLCMVYLIFCYFHFWSYYMAYCGRVWVHFNGFSWLVEFFKLAYPDILIYHCS